MIPAQASPPDTPAERHFILGGARSGKSAYAEQLALTQGGTVSYLATARIGDREFAERVALHQARRPTIWSLIEAPIDLAGALDATGKPGQVVLIDCLTLWMVNLLCPPDTDAPLADWQARIDSFAEVLARTEATVLIVSNEIGLGVVPMGALTRRYVDELGRLNQRIAASCNRVTLMVAGIPLAVKRD